MSVIPTGNARYARDRGWLGPDEASDDETVVSTLHRQVTDRCPTADFHHPFVGRYAPSGAISKRVRNLAKREDASTVFVGSENAGRLVTALGSFGGSIAADDDCDVVVHRASPPRHDREAQRGLATPAVDIRLLPAGVRPP